MIFQDPYSSLEPAHDGRRDHRRRAAAATSDRRGADIREQRRRLAARVGLEPDHMSRYPHEFSGGQRQRIGIARALILEPEVRRLRRADLGARRVGAGAGRQSARTSCKASLGLTLLFIAHDLSMVRYVSDRMAVMYLGLARRDRRRRRRLLRAAAPLHAVRWSASNPEPDPRIGTAPRGDRDQGRDPVAGQRPRRAAASPRAARM